MVSNLFVRRPHRPSDEPGHGIVCIVAVVYTSIKSAWTWRLPRATHYRVFAAACRPSGELLTTEPPAQIDIKDVFSSYM